MDSRQFIESGALETYAMGLATEQEAKLVAEMVARYPEVKAELAAIEASIEKFDQQNAVAPPAHLKSEILTKISKVPGSQFSVPGSVRSVSSSPVENKERGKVVSLNSNDAVKQNNFYKYAAAVALLFLVGSLYYNYSLSDRLAAIEGEQKVSDSAVEALYAQLTTQKEDLKIAQGQIALLKTPDMKSVELKGMDVAPDAKAMAYANTKTGEVYLEIMNLPAAPDGMQYQFWGIVDNKPVSAGMIPVEEKDIAGIHPMTTVPNAGAYAISLEPMGGSDQPTGKIYVMGQP